MKRTIVTLGLGVLLSVLVCGKADAAPLDHHLIRRVAVFPLKVDKPLQKSADEAWWKIREILTDHQRFMVASRRFLQQKDVFQARGELEPADAIILGKLLDANALVTTYLQNKTLVMKVYEGENGRILWEHELQLQPSLPVASQLKQACEKLIYDFIASIPYQGFVVTDPLIGSPVFERKGENHFKAEVASLAQIATGDKVQLIRVTSQSLDPLFLEGAVIEVFAEGHVVEVERQTVTVKIDRVTSLDQIKDMSLVRLPSELQRLRQSFALEDKWRRQVAPEFLSPEMTSTEQEVKEYKPLAASLSFLINLATFLVLAF